MTEGDDNAVLLPEPGTPETGAPEPAGAANRPWGDPHDPDRVLADYAPGLLHRIDDCFDIDDLAAAAEGHAGLIRVLAVVGLPVMAIARTVGRVNEHVMDRLFHLTIPAEIADNACLIVMGSEGRSEQLLKTDQDNGLILRDGFRPAGLESHLERFSAGLARLGWPPCKGHVMVTNPFWVREQRGWAETVALWIHMPDEAAAMNLAIFADSVAVAGDRSLLDAPRRAMLDSIAGHGHFLSRFAHISLGFPTPLGWFGHLLTEGGAHKGRLDLKKGGIFPIVHGVRALSLEARLRQTNTLDRLAALVAVNRHEIGLAMDLRWAFEFLVGLRLKVRLTAADPTASDNMVAPDLLAQDERDDLRKAFKTVNRFKELLTHHFHLELF